MELYEAIEKISEDNKSEIFVLVGAIDDDIADKFIKTIRNKKDKKDNLSLILTTNGGDPDAGYRMVRAIKRYYKEFVLYVYGSCKSTGTLMAIGANKIVMSDFGEFGPLDIQLTKDDELKNMSGLNYVQSILSLNERLFQSFESNFLNLKKASSNTITTKTAGEISSRLAVGLISPISAQIDPIKLGEVLRAVTIAEKYGSRLSDNTDAISKLITEYPSHGFVIDFEEAKTMLGDDIVRYINETELIIEENYIHAIRREGKGVIFVDLLEVAKAERKKSEPEEVKEEISNSVEEVKNEVSPKIKVEIKPKSNNSVEVQS